MARRYGGVALLMAGIVAVAVGITAFTGVRRPAAAKRQIVATFYPIYIAALNVANGVEGVEVVSLTQPQAGCLHDYQLSPDNRITLAGADILVINGAGAESFLDGVLQELGGLPVIDTSAGIPLLHAGHDHDHDHEEEGHEGHTFDNEHIWTSPTRYAQQVENLRDELSRQDPANADRYAVNAAAYLTRIEEVRQELAAAAAELPYKTSVIFHDSLAYFADDLGLPVVATLAIGEEAGASAAELAQAQQAATVAGRVLLLYDGQYPPAYAYVADGAREKRALTLDMAVSGAADKDAWLTAMRRNAARLRGEA